MIFSSKKFPSTKNFYIGNIIRNKKEASNAIFLHLYICPNIYYLVIYNFLSNLEVFERMFICSSLLNNQVLGILAPILHILNKSQQYEIGFESLVRNLWLPWHFSKSKPYILIKRSGSRLLLDQERRKFWRTACWLWCFQEFLWIVYSVSQVVVAEMAYCLQRRHRQWATHSEDLLKEEMEGLGLPISTF